MPGKTPARPVAVILCLTLAVGAAPAWASQTIRCASEYGRYRYCRADTDNEVRLERQRSGARCREGYSWGYDRRGVWVDHGCEAEFRVGKGGGDNKGAAVGAAIVGIAILAAIAAQNKTQPAEDVPAWAIGDYTGYDEYERTDVQLKILPGGNVSGYAGQTSFEGHFQGSKLETARQTFSVERSGNGFLAIDDRNPGHRVYFRRSGGGY